MPTIQVCFAYGMTNARLTDLDRRITERRADTAFMARLREIIAADAVVLTRLSR